MKPINVGLLGLGTVGGGTLTVLRRNAGEITRRAGREITVKMAAVRDLEKARKLAGNDLEIVTDPMAVVQHLRTRPTGADGEPSDGDDVEVDCSGDEGVVRG